MGFRKLIKQRASEFQHASKQAGTVFTTHKKGPSSRLDIRRLRTSKPFRSKIHVTTPPKKKKIILSDLALQRAAFFSSPATQSELEQILPLPLPLDGRLPEDNRAITLLNENYSVYVTDEFRMIDTLLKENHEIYVINTQGSLKKIDPTQWFGNSAYVKQLFENALLVKRSEIINRLESMDKELDLHHITLEQCLILDHQAIEHFKQLEVNPEAKVTTKKLTLNFQSWLNEKDRKKILDAIEASEIDELEIYFNASIENNLTDAHIAILKEMEDVYFKHLKIITLAGINATPPSLKKLNKIKRVNFFKSYNIDSSLLPPEIEIIHTEGVNNQWDFSHLAHLKEIRLNGYSDNCDTLPKLPDGITSVAYFVSDIAPDEIDLSKYPITDLEIAVPQGCKKPKIHFNLSKLNKLSLKNIDFKTSLGGESLDLRSAENLTELYIQNCRVINIHHCSKKLKKLALINLDPATTIDSLEQHNELTEVTLENISSIPRLPQSIQHLRIKSRHNKKQGTLDLRGLSNLKTLFLRDWTGPILWPPHLQKLTIIMNYEGCPIDLSGLSKLKSVKLLFFSKESSLPTLPRTIKNIDVYNCDLKENDLLAYPDLESITFTLGLNPSRKKSDTFFALPKTIKKLVISDILGKIPDLSKYEQLEEVVLDHLDIDEIPKLPAGIKKLIIKNCEQLNGKLQIDLSQYKELNSLEFSKLNISQSPKLPAQLKSLKVNKCQFRCDLTTYKALTHVVLMETPYPKLPPNVQHLTLENDGYRILPDFSTYKSLRYLDIAWCRGVTKDWKFHPSENLEYLKIASHLPQAKALEQSKYIVEKYKHLDIFDHEALEIDAKWMSASSGAAADSKALKSKASSKVSEHESDAGIADRPLTAVSSKAARMSGSAIVPTRLDTATVTKWWEKKQITTYAIYSLDTLMSAFTKRLTKVNASLYREEVKDQISHDNKEFLVFKPLLSPESYQSEGLQIDYVDSFSKPTLLAQMTDEHYFVDYELKSNDWTPLPGLTSSDRILQMTKLIEVDIRFNLHTHQYEVKSQQPHAAPIKIQYFAVKNKPLDIAYEKKYESNLDKKVLAKLDEYFKQVQKDESQEFSYLKIKINEQKSKPLNEKFEFVRDELVDYFKDFTNKDFKSIADDVFLDTLMQKVGACRHRAFIFVVLSQYLGIPARIISNETHAYAEIYNGTKWLQVQLGGHFVFVKNTEKELTFKTSTEEKKEVGSKIPSPMSDAPASLQEVLPKEAKISSFPMDEKKDVLDSLTTPLEDYFSPDVSEEKVFNNVSQIINYFLAQKRIAVKPQSLQEGQALRAALVEQIKKTDIPYLYIESKNDFEELNQQILELIKNKGILIINWDRLSANEMSSDKTILDIPPTYLGQPVSPELQVINFLPSRTVRSQVLPSRVPHFEWPEGVPRLSLKPIPLKSHLPDLKSVVEFDLFSEADDWQQILIGDYIPGKDGKPQYTYSKFIKALSSSSRFQNAVLIDPPLHDPNFVSFIQRVLIDRHIYVNNEKITVPDDFTIHFVAAPEIKEPPKNLHVVSNLENKRDSDIFYLSPDTLHLLASEILIGEGKDIQISSGWLDQPGKDKVIIQTAPLSAGQQRHFYTLLAAAKSQPQIQLLDICQFDKKQQPLKKIVSPKTSCLIETQDPNFVSHILLQDSESGTEVIKINSQSDANDLIEAIEFLDDDKSEAEEIRYEVRKLAQALISGKHIILSGSLSYDAYQSISSVFGIPPTLKLMTESKSKKITGQLTVVTTPLAYLTPLASYQDCLYRVPENTLWQAYEMQLSKQNVRFNPEHFTKIRRFYELANLVPHGQTGMPAEVRLSFERVQKMLAVLADEKLSLEDNPIKSLFQYDYSKDTEYYAYLNVVAKSIFGKDYSLIFSGGKAAAYRKDKLEKYPDRDEFRWRRANCLNANAIKKLLGATKPHLELPIRDKVNQWIAANKDKIILKGKNQQDKILKRMEANLKKHHAVVLKGPPGTGKTYLSLYYANQPHHKLYWGEKAIDSWKSSKPKPGEKCVLVFDEANMASLGTLDVILKHTSNEREVIFTCNPEEYQSRIHHAALQDIPTLYVKSWTPESIKKYILLPLCQSSFEFKSDKQYDTALNKLIKAYFLARDWLPADTLSLRDIQQLTCRWLYLLRTLRPENAALQAILNEWGSSFNNAQKAHQFKRAIEDTLHIKVANAKIQTSISLTADERGEFYLSKTRAALLSQIAEDMKLASQLSDKVTPDGAPLVKSGVLLEGPSGLGKSTLMRGLMTTLQLTGISVQQLLTESSKPADLRAVELSQCYVQFTVTNNIDFDTEVLLAAFKSGCKIILDELNLSPSLETTLNHIMTGKTPDGKPPEQKGFFVFASQNNLSSEGTEAISKALANRFHSIYAQEDTKEDLLEIADSALPFLTKAQHLRIVEAFLKQKQAYPRIVNSRHFFQGLTKLKKDLLQKHPGLATPITVDLVKPKAKESVKPDQKLEEKIDVTDDETPGIFGHLLGVENLKSLVALSFDEYASRIESSQGDQKSSLWKLSPSPDFASAQRFAYQINNLNKDETSVHSILALLDEYFTQHENIVDPHSFSMILQKNMDAMIAQSLAASRKL